MNTTTKMAIALLGLLITTTRLIYSEDPTQAPPPAKEPAPRFFLITNLTGMPVQIFLTAVGWQYASKGSGGNLAFDTRGNLDPEGAIRTLQPGEAAKYQWDDARMGFCIGKPAGGIKVKLPTSPDFTGVIEKNNPYKGCPNQNIILTIENGLPVATFNYTDPAGKTP